MIFGGEAFKDWIGELSLLLELSKSAELSGYSDDADKKKDTKTAELGLMSQRNPMNRRNKSLTLQRMATNHQLNLAY